MHHCVTDDAGDMGVGQGVGDLATPALCVHEVGGAQHPEVLRHERLRHAERVDQLVDAPGAGAELLDDRQAVGAGEGPQQVGGNVEGRSRGHRVGGRGGSHGPSLPMRHFAYVTVPVRPVTGGRGTVGPGFVKVGAGWQAGRSDREEGAGLMGAVVDATKDTFDELVGTGNVLVDVWGPECRPCFALMPHVETMAEERADLTVVKLEAPTARRLCMRLRVMGLPAFLFYRDGEEVGRLSGGDITPASLRDWLDSLSGASAS